MTEPLRPMKPIPISAGKMIADAYGYDQVVIIARRVGHSPDPVGEHVTTFGSTVEYCAVAARMGDVLKHRVMGWPAEIGDADLRRLAAVVRECFGDHSLISTADYWAATSRLAERLGIVTLPERSR